MAYRLARAAEAEVDRILLDSAKRFGLEAAERYSRLLVAAMAAVGDDPELPGAREIPRLTGIRAYPIQLRRFRIAPAERVGTPRHILVYRISVDDVVDILGVVHDRMVLFRAALRAVREADRASDA